MKEEKFTENDDHTHQRSHDINTEEDDTSKHEVTLNDDFYAWFFLIHITGRYDELSDKDKCFYWFAVLLTFIMQVFCLFVLALSFAYQYGQYLEEHKGQDDWSVFNMDKWIAEQAPIHFLCAIVALFVLFVYLASNIKPFVVLLEATLNCAEPKLTQKAFYYAICASMLNIALNFTTWMFSMYIAFFGLYLQTENPSDVVLTSVGNVFILEMDDWIFQWFKLNTDFDMITQVYSKQYNKGFKSGTTSMLIVYFFTYVVWMTSAADFYGNAIDGNPDSVVSYSFTILFVESSCIFGFAILGLIPLTIFSELCKRIFICFFWIVLSLLNIIFGCFVHVGMDYWPANIKPTEIVHPVTTWCVIRWIMGFISVILLGSFMCLEFKFYPSNIYFLSNKQLKNRLFISSLIIPVLCAVEVLFEYGSEESEVILGLSFGSMAFICKYYLNDMFKKNGNIQVKYECLKWKYGC